MRQYYIRYKENSNINYCFLFSLYLLAEKDNDKRLYTTISYSSQKELSHTIKHRLNYDISQSTVSRALKDTEYKEYFTVDTINHYIILKNDFAGTGKHNKFIVLTDKEINFLIQQNDNLLIKYYLYIKYYCGYNRNKQIDTTANQILSALGYSTKSGNTKTKLSQYNNLLLANGFILIQRIKDNNGFNRNVYRMNI